MITWQRSCMFVTDRTLGAIARSAPRTHPDPGRYPIVNYRRRLMTSSVFEIVVATGLASILLLVVVGQIESIAYYVVATLTSLCSSRRPSGERRASLERARAELFHRAGIDPR